MTLLRVTNLTKRFGDKEVVKGLNFELEKGHCLALLGPNGAGKTTTLSMIAGLLSKTKGNVTINGETKNNRENIGYLPQFPSFYSWMTGREYLIFVGQLSKLSKKMASQKADELLDWVKLGNAKKRKIGGYSGGMKQRLGLAQTMIHEPKLLILDEPVSALDPVGRREVLEMMKGLKKQSTILFSTHVLHDAEELSDDIVILTEGKIAVAGSLKEIKKEKQRPVLKIQSDEDFAPFIEGIKRDEVIDGINEVGKTLEIYVKDIDQGRQMVLTWITENRFPINRLESGTSTLEDLFMKVVGA